MALPPIIRAPKGQNARGVGRGQFTAPGTYHQTAPARPVYVPPPSLSPQQHGGGTDIQSSGANYGSGQATRYKQTPAYRNAVISTFRAQSPAQQQAIISGAQRHNTLEGSLILQHLSGGSVWDLKNTGGSLSEKAISKSGGLPAAVSLPLSLLAPGADAQSGAALFKNAANDAINLPKNTAEGLAKVGSDAANLRAGNVFHDLADPYIHLAQHPFSDFAQHPLNTGLMFAGAEATLGRGAGAIARSGALGDAAKVAAGTAREPVRMPIAGAKPGEAVGQVLHERSYSPNVITKAAQVAWEKHLRARGINPNVARGRTLTRHLNTVADEMTAVRQMAGRDDRGRAVHAMQSNRPVKRVENIVSHIVQGVVRTPKTAIADLTKERDRLTAQLTGKRTPDEMQRRAQIRDISAVLEHSRHIPAAFDAATPLRSYLNANDASMVKNGLLNPDQAMRSKLFPYAQAHMGATYDPAHGLVSPEHPNGIPTDTILRHLKDNGVPDPAYVGHYPGKGAFWQFYQKYRLARGSAAGHARTGEAFKRGNYDHSYDALVAQAARSAEIATKAQLHDKVVSRFGITKPVELRKPGENGMFTPAEAKKFAYGAIHDDNHNVIPGRMPLVPVTAGPRNAMDLLPNLQHPTALDQGSDRLELKALNGAMHDASTRTDGTRNVVLIPQAAADRFKQQFEKTGNRTIGKVTQQFRRTVLPYSTHWMTQIGSEAVLRSLVSGVLDPRNVVAGRQLMGRLTKTTEGRAALQEMVNATFYGSHKTFGIHNPNHDPLTAFVKTAPVTKQIIAAHNHYANAVTAAMYHLEHEFRVMGLGKLARRQLQEFTGSYQAAIGLQAKNLEHLATRLETNPALVAKFGRQIDETFGKYNKLSPKTRAAVQTVAPFLPWYLNAARFVLYTLPVKHPVASALLASLRQTINQDVADGKQEPLNPFQVEALNRFTPFGVYTSPEPGRNGKPGQSPVGSLIASGADFLLPQAKGAYNALEGQSPFGGASLKGPNGDVTPESGPAVESMLNELLQSFLPGARYAQVAREGGRPAYGTSTPWNPQPKPDGAGGTGQVLNRLFNPFHALQSAGSPPSSSGGGWGSGGSGSSGGGWGGGGSSSGSSGGGWGGGGGSSGGGW